MLKDELSLQIPVHSNPRKTTVYCGAVIVSQLFCPKTEMNLEEKDVYGYELSQVLGNSPCIFVFCGRLSGLSVCQRNISNETELLRVSSRGSWESLVGIVVRQFPVKSPSISSLTPSTLTPSQAHWVLVHISSYVVSRWEESPAPEHCQVQVSGSSHG